MSRSGDYRERIENALAEGWRFGGLHAAEGGGVVRVLLFASDGSTRVESAEVARGEITSIVDLVPAAGWDE